MKQVSEATIERARVLMSDGSDRSTKDLSVALGITDTSAAHAIKALHVRKLVYIVCYDRAPGNHRSIAIYRIGNERDARKPKDVANRKGVERSREREWLSESRATGKTIFRHPWDVWLFGECAEITPSTLPRHVIRQDMTGESLEAR